MLSHVSTWGFCCLFFYCIIFFTILEAWPCAEIFLSKDTSCLLEVETSCSFLNQCLSQGDKNVCMTYMICFHNDECSLVRKLIIKIETRL